MRQGGVWAAWLAWGLGAMLLIYIAGIDLYVHEQIPIAVLCLGLLIYLRFRLWHEPSLSPARMARMTMLLVGGFVAMRYFLWRVQFSIPWEADRFSIFCSILLLVAEAMALILYFLGMYINIHPLWRTPKPVDLRRRDLPTVDVYVPTYNESPEILRATLLGCMSMEYPRDKVHVYLLDDGSTDARCARTDKTGEAARERRQTLQALCREIGCRYLTREDNQFAKAGNLNAAFARTNGEYVAVFDADHVPTRDFLVNTVGLMIDAPDRAMVQTPHFMINSDPVAKNLAYAALVPGEEEMFYTIGLRGMDTWNTGFFCGSGALLRRKALAEIGGFPTDTIVEDAETSMELLRRGWRSAYLHRPMLSALAAESVEAFFVQRSRWAHGMTQLLRLRNPLGISGLSLPQRLAYFNCSFYWVFSLAFLVFLSMPVIALLSGATVFAASPSEIMAFLVPYLAAIFIVSNALYGRVRWPFASEIYETLQAFYLPRHVLSALLRPRKGEFHVTPKGQVLKEDTFLRAATPVFFFVLLQIVASVAGVYLISNEEWGMQAYLTQLAWNIYNFLFTMGVLGVMYERHQKRARPRIEMRDVAKVDIGGRTIPCEIRDMNEDGAKLRLPSWINQIKQKEGRLLFSGASVPSSGGSLTTVMENLVAVPFRIMNVRKLEGEARGEDALEIGVKFGEMDLETRKGLVTYVYGSSERWREILKKRNRQSTFGLGFRFLFWAVFQGFRHFVWRLAHPFGGPRKGGE